MNQTLLNSIVKGLNAPQASIEPKYFYDLEGSKLFEEITLTPEYYPTRVEKSIFESSREAIANSLMGVELFIDLGAGSCEKAKNLFDAIQPKKYLALDVAVDFVEHHLELLRPQFPNIQMQAQVCDLSQPINLEENTSEKKVFFYPGSSIGNFDPKDALVLLQNIVQLTKSTGGLLIGVDLVKDLQVLERAYDDAQGVTAAFNLNVLAHINQLIDTNFDLSNWRHVAFFNTSASRIEMHLEAVKDVRVEWPGGQREFQQGERIHTENSYKYSIASFDELLRQAGFTQVQHWTDPKEYFGIFYASF